MKLLLLLATVALAQAQDPVKVELYYESFCPYCVDFIVNQLYPTWNEIGEIMQVELYPFGKAHYTTQGNGWTFTCQHGNAECKGNMIAACAQNKLNDINLEMEFIYCLQSASWPPNAGATCAAQVGADWAPIENCINSEEGQNLLHDVAVKQEQLSPSVYYVPWIVVNDFWRDNQNYDCQTNLKKVVCDKFTGPKPDACNAFTHTEELVGHKPHWWGGNLRKIP